MHGVNIMNGKGSSKRGMESGVYLVDDYISVPIGAELDEITRLHEYEHIFLTKATYWGNMLYMQRQLMRADHSLMRLQYHQNIAKVMMEAAESTFESDATIYQLLFAKFRNRKRYEELLEGLYYQIYCTKYFDLFLNMKLPYKKLRYYARKISLLALATDLMDIRAEKWKTEESIFQAIQENPSKYYPDFRFEKLVDAFCKLIQCKKINKIRDEDLLNEAGIEAKDITYHSYIELDKSFENVMYKVFPNDQTIRQAFKAKCMYTKRGELSEQLGNMYYSDIPIQEQNYEVLQLYRVEEWLQNASVLALLGYYEAIHCQFYFIEEKKRYYGNLNWNLFEDMWIKFSGPIVVYGEDYAFMHEHFSKLNEKRVFYFYQSGYKVFLDDIKYQCESIPPVFAFFINEDIACIFVKGKGNEIFFTVQRRGGLDSFIDDIVQKKLNYILYDDSKKDDFFFTEKGDKQVYESVVKSILQVDSVIGRCNINLINN